jgi:hypothetical protein
MEDLGDEKDVRARKRRVGKQQKGLDDTLRGIMGSGTGRAWIWYILSTCRSFELEVPSDAIAMAFRNGERNVGIRLLADVMRVAPDEFVAMMREANGMIEDDGSSGSDDNSGDGEPPAD